jgi:hypothetical protein
MRITLALVFAALMSCSTPAGSRVYVAAKNFPRMTCAKDVIPRGLIELKTVKRAVPDAITADTFGHLQGKLARIDIRRGQQIVEGDFVPFTSLPNYPPLC